MKKCPQCGRDYDNTMSFCLDDGSELLYGPAKSEPPASAGGQFDNEPQTAILHTTKSSSEAATRAQIQTTEKTAVLPSGVADISRSKGFDKRLIFVPLLLAAIVLGGFFGYRSFKSSASSEISSIAVLPFQNKSGDADSEYLSDGLSESLIYRLSQIPDLKVSPRSSVFRYKGQDVDAEKIGAALGVDAVMSGRMVQRGDNLTISVDLVDVKNKKTLWGEQFEKKMSDLLATQREIASAITQKLQLKLSGDDAKGITKKYTDNNEAYQAYLKGRYYWNKRTTENLKKAIEQFKAATDSDPNFALAYAGLADCYGLLSEYSGVPASETLPQAKANAERAIAIDDQLAEAHTSMGMVYVKSWQWADAEREFKRAIEINPNYATAYHFYCVLLRSLGRFDEAAEMIQRAHELDPLSSVISVNVSGNYMLRKDYEGMAANSRKVVELDPTYPGGYSSLGSAYLRLGRNAEAIANFEKGVELSNRASPNLAVLGYGYAVTGNRQGAVNIIKELEERYAKKEATGGHIAIIYAGLGEKDEAFEWVEKDFQAHSGELVGIRWGFASESLRDDPRFKDLLKRMGLP